MATFGPRRVSVTDSFTSWVPLFIAVGVVLAIGVVAALSKSVVDQFGRSGWQFLIEW
jgi:hypothetical protein